MRAFSASCGPLNRELVQREASSLRLQSVPGSEEVGAGSNLEDTTPRFTGVRSQVIKRTKRAYAMIDEEIRTPKGSDIKKRIESLIGREYIERHEDNPQMYSYLA